MPLSAATLDEDYNPIEANAVLAYVRRCRSCFHLQRAKPCGPKQTKAWLKLRCRSCGSRDMYPGWSRWVVEK